MTRTHTNRMTPRLRDPRACVAALLLGLSACNQLEKLDESGSASGGDSIPTDVQRAFEGSCGTSPACHAAGGSPPTLEGAGIGALIGMPSPTGVPYITLGDSANSYIALKMLPQDVVDGLGAMRMGSRMPLDLDYASGNEERLDHTRTILAWIGGADYPGGGGGTEDTGDLTTTDATTTGASTTGEPLEPTFTNVKSVIFPSCGCHNSDPNDALNGNFTMKTGMEYASIVNVKSGQLATMDFIKPSDPDTSYLFLKMTNKHLDAGGSGETMPQFSPVLPADKLMLIEEWIAAGALDN